jgi:uroporphyrinogen-III synthase
MTTALDGIKVLVTRPEQQAEALCGSIEKLGGTAIRFPVIEVKQSGNQQAAKTILNNINQYDMGIFISRNAVDWTIRLLGDKQSALDDLNLIAIGAATAERLEQATSSRVITNSGANSEALLEIEALTTEEIRGKKIIIFRGEGGREHLATTLRERGAEVDYAEVYRRDCPEYGKDVISELWTSNTPDAVVVTSNNGLENLFSLLDKEQRNLLINKQLVVMGERMLDFSIEFGFTRPPILAEENSDEGILNAIVKWAASKDAISKKAGEKKNE